MMQIMDEDEVNESQYEMMCESISIPEHYSSLIESKEP